MSADVSDEGPCQGRTRDPVRVEVVEESHRIADQRQVSGEESERKLDNDETIAPRHDEAGAAPAKGTEEEHAADLYQEDDGEAGQRRNPAVAAAPSNHDLDAEQHCSYPQ